MALWHFFLVVQYTVEVCSAGTLSKHSCDKFHVCVWQFIYFTHVPFHLYQLHVQLFAHASYIKYVVVVENIDSTCLLYRKY